MSKAQECSEIYGFADPIELCEEYISDSVCPGICTNPDCDYTTEVEPDCRDGYCEECKTQSLKSVMVLIGVI